VHNHQRGVVISQKKKARQAETRLLKQRNPLLTPMMANNEPDAPLSIYARISRLVKFSFVGASGVLLILLLTWAFTEHYGLFYLLSAALAMELSILWTFALNAKITFRHSFNGSRNLFSALGNYQLIMLAGNLMSLVLIFWFTTYLHLFYLVSELAAIIITFGFGYLMNLRFVWKTKYSN
jgi:dolichol-phosphate mannosyltransferase